MIVVRVELHSAINHKVTEIARMRIANIGGTRERGFYRAESFRGRSAPQLDRQQVTRRGTVRDYPRLSVHVWHLVARALIAMGYAGERELAQPSDLLEAIGDVPGQRAP